MDPLPILSEATLTELRPRIKFELARYWKNYRTCWVYQHTLEMFWQYEDGWRTLGPKNHGGRWKNDNIHFWTNKLTALYFLPETSTRLSTFACIYKQWFTYHSEEPNIEFYRSFAEPAFAHHTTIKEMVEAHKRYCDQTSQIAKSQWDPEKPYSVLPSFRAIFLMIDEDYEGEVHGERDGLSSLEKLSQQQYVWMVRTGDESELSAPITFHGIEGPVSQKGEEMEEGVEAVRVPLGTAIRFISVLEDREEAVSLSTGEKVRDQSLAPIYHRKGKEYWTTSSQVWIQNVLEEAEEVGFEKIYCAKMALRRALAAKAGTRDERAELELADQGLFRYWK